MSLPEGAHKTLLERQEWIRYDHPARSQWDRHREAEHCHAPHPPSQQYEIHGHEKSVTT